MNGFVISLTNVLYVSNICRNLVSMPLLDKKGYTIEFKYDNVIISKDGVSMKYMRNHKMYVLNLDSNKVSIYDYMNISKDFIYLWHLILWHINKNKISECVKVD